MKTHKMKKTGQRWQRHFQQVLNQETSNREERELQTEHASAEHESDSYAVYATYAACIFGLFVLFSAITGIKTTLWGFGIIHTGFTFILLGLWWWEERLWAQKNGEGSPRYTIFDKLPHPAQSPSLTD